MRYTHTKTKRLTDCPSMEKETGDASNASGRGETTHAST